MNNPKFYIYGVPDGFNMLSGTPDEILYYQLFYDTSKRGREMRINRKSNGETVYSYLIYNFVSCKGREGAFLGMSVVFSDNEYCNNPYALKDLFEGVYNEVILKAEDKDKIIEAIDGGNAVGRFCIPKFDERQDMCEKIGRIIVNNVVSELASNISTIDDSFDNSKEGRILTLPIGADNISINKALRNYTWVSLSSEYSAIPVSKPQSSSQKYLGHNKTTSVAVSQDLLSVHFINELTKKIGIYKDFIIKGLKGLLSSSDIAVKRKEINNYLDTIEEYVSRQPELNKLKADYMSIYEELVDLKSQSQSVPQQPVAPTFPPTNNNGDDKDWFMKFVQQHFLQIIVSVLAFIIVVLVVKLWPSNESQSTLISDDESKVVEAPKSSTDDVKAFDENKFKSLLDSADYKAAWSMLQKVRDAEKQGSLKMEWQNSYRNWFDKELKKRQKDSLRLVGLKSIIAAYADFNEDNEWNKKLLDECIARLPKSGGVGSGQQNRQAGKGAQSDSTMKGGSATGKPNQTNIKIFKADANYSYRKKDPILAIGNVIRCRRKECFVVEGAKLSSKDEGIEADPKDGIIRIRVTGVGTFKVKLNEVEYTFNVIM